MIGLKYSCDVISVEGGRGPASQSLPHKESSDKSPASQSAINAHKINHPHPLLSQRASVRNLFIILGDPRKMFTDSSFYSAKHHPTVADQVEMAHKLSSAMFNEKNK